MPATWMGKEWLGYEPASYAQKTIKACGLKEPPFDEGVIADYLGIRIFEIQADAVDLYKSMVPKPQLIDEIMKHASTSIIFHPDGSKLLMTPAGVPSTRRRMNIGHECGHVVTPWHDQHCFLCQDRDMDPLTHKKMEQEAFQGGSELLMPCQFFMDDALGLGGISIANIEMLSKRYLVSLEATANWYAQNHPGICAVLFLEPTDKMEPLIERVQHFSFDQQLLRVGQPYVSHRTITPEPGRLRVKYAIRSPRFRDYIPAGTLLGETSPLVQHWKDNTRYRGELKPVDFDLLGKPPYLAESMNLGYRNLMMVLLWNDDQQSRFSLNLGGF